MRLSEAQTVLLRFLHERFPTPYRETGEAVKPRAKYQPPTQQEALDTLGIDPATWDDSIAFLTAHELVRKVYRHGTEEYEEITLAPGHTMLLPIAKDSAPPDADPADERYGVHCYQITDHVIQVLEKLATPRPEATAMSTAAAALSPKVFMSYSWDGPEHQDWVKALAAKLRGHGVDVTLDQWNLAPGDLLPRFMEAAVRENEHVLIVCTPKYKEKSDARKGGVGYEGDIMTAEVLNGQNARKFVPILRQGEWKEVAPSWLAGRFYLNFCCYPYSEDTYEELLNNLYGTREQAPPLGTRPPVTSGAITSGQGTLVSPSASDDSPIKIKGIILDEIGTPRNDGTQGSCPLQSSLSAFATTDGDVGRAFRPDLGQPAELHDYASTRHRTHRWCPHYPRRNHGRRSREISPRHAESGRREGKQRCCRIRGEAASGGGEASGASPAARTIGPGRGQANQLRLDF